MSDNRPKVLMTFRSLDEFAKFMDLSDSPHVYWWDYGDSANVVDVTAGIGTHVIAKSPGVSYKIFEEWQKNVSPKAKFFEGRIEFAGDR